ncbi:ABC transporter ATP-binding protein [Verminephrobacter eiseniae]|uniref:ABC transporter related n=1 Tax=Verminephrobacter eiseniae (strain EF01-2) TaxID=391735 RepID=A1WGG8_VEREI|nr:sn-glycerol-3-phosphate ABC transporter ATP-binding protein UgpC [Verminephrobacter eiseniae]ABM56725.1 ABC transporter related [Verminephrobacter eiseniae EF01-2]MCW5287081.1 sn-glycerol-3-phosphate ABC transporter ATP-binding protein UgpC [Verminephrobacter eiseniae]MCW5305379.1 sn-glycerol-3-phosphate ABC transporter ATP-binding protein UgpC [Verminephrobacter eiseniae]MCW8180470.1 sn-glycerol-3-phosphate ABC transporter ATP-binding protein UgpC [Verminephrobacter eiseniae]MCW8192122.1 s
MTQVTLEAVHKTYDGGVQAIRGVDLEIGAGEFCVFLGPSGCGKSTLLRMVAGLESITAGDLHIGGIRMNDVPPAQRQVAMVFQNYALYPHMTLYENMAFGLRQARLDKREIERRVQDAAQILQIGHLLDRLPRALSGGQRQRVAIGRAIVRKPDVFLFDEPLSNLDAALRVHMRAEIARLHREFGHASAIYVTHDQTEAMALADKIVLLRSGQDMLDNGSVAQIGSPMELYHRPRDLFVAGFIGAPKMNLLPATVLACRDGCVVLQLDAGVDGERIELSERSAMPAVASRVTLGIRPEHLLTGRMGDAATITRRVRLVEHFGEHSYVHLDGAGNGESLIAKVIGHSHVRPGDNGTFSIVSTHCHLFDAAGCALAQPAPIFASTP